MLTNLQHQRSNIKIFAITKSVVNIFNKNFACRQRNNRYISYQTGFQFKGLGSIPSVGLRVYQSPKINFFQNMAMFHIKLKGMKCTTCKQMFCPYRLSIPEVWSKGQNNVLKVVKLICKLHIILKEMKYTTACKQTFCTYTHLTPGMLPKGQKQFLF